MASEATTADHGNGVATQQLVDAVQLAVTHLSQQQEVETEAASTSGDGEPPAKRARSDSEGGDFAMDQSIKQILFNINKAICLRLDAIENKLETVSIRCKYLEEKVEQIVGQMKQTPGVVVNPSPGVKRSVSPPRTPRSGAVIVGLPQEREPPDSPQSNSSMSPMDHSLHNLGPNVTLITLNTEEDFPNGTWLGDENNPEMRVRVPVTPSDLLHVHSNCRTPEKMALTLLDYLFDRETQACSNLSGMGKHGKKQLDPLMIYGIRCHLIHKFGITEQDWHRIKQNIDSKCRTAFRRKLRGLSLTVKAFRGKAPSTYVQMQSPGQIGMGAHGDGTLSGEDAELHIAQGEVEMQGVPGIMQPHQAAELLQSGEIQVLHATPEQVAQLQQAHQIQILQGDTTQVLQTLQGADGQEGIHVAVSMAQPDGIHVVTTDTGETIQINQVNQVPEPDAEDTPSQESEQEPDQ